MKITRKNLLAALEQPVRICNSKVGRSNGSQLLIRADGGWFVVEANDGDQSIVSMVEAEGVLMPVCVSPHKINTAAAFASDVVELDAIESGVQPDSGQPRVCISYKSGVRSLKINTIPAETFNHMKPSGRPTVAPLDLIVKVARMVKLAAEESSGRYIMKSVHVIGTKDSIRCESSRGVEVARLTEKAICGDFNIIIPSQFISTVAAELAKKGAELLVGESTITINSESSVYTCKLLDGVFPNTDQVFSQEITPIGMIARDEWVETFSCIRSLRSESEALLVNVALEFSENGCVISTNSDEPYHQVVEGKFNPMKINVNGIGFFDCLDLFPSGSTIAIGVIGNTATVLQEGGLEIASCQVRQ